MQINDAYIINLSSRYVARYIQPLLSASASSAAPRHALAFSSHTLIERLVTKWLVHRPFSPHRT